MINLFINPFVCNDPARQEEYDYCYKRNIENKHIDRIFLVSVLGVPDGKPTYTQFFQKMAQFPDDVNIIANLDIYFDDTLQLVNHIAPDECYALTRWELWNDQVVFFETRNPAARAKHSQDCWVFRGAPKFEADFSMGVPGCDNKLAYMLHVHRFKLTNPCYSIKTIHVHAANTRPHHVGERVRGPYHWIDPQELVIKV